VSVLCPGAVRTNILGSERNRPVGLRNEPVEITPEMRAFGDFMKAEIEAGMSPLQVADHVFKAIKEERFYILTHPELMPLIQLRMDSIIHGDNPRGLDNAKGKGVSP
jgi:short-subunit dehydrogenase